VKKYTEQSKDVEEARKEMSADEREVILRKVAKAEDKMWEFLKDHLTFLHETLHFHQHLLLPAMQVWRNLLDVLVDKNSVLIENASDNLMEGIEPFDNIDITPGKERKYISLFLNYYFGTNLPCGEVVGKIGDNPIMHIYQVKSDEQEANIPVAILDGEIYPLGLQTMLENWSWILTRAYLEDSGEKKILEQYKKGKQKAEYWPYYLIEKILRKVIGNSFDRISESGLYRIISNLVITVCSVDPRFNANTWESYWSDEACMKHPGWRLAYCIEYLWQQRSAIDDLDLSDAEMWVGVIRTWGSILESKGVYTLAEEFTRVEKYLFKEETSQLDSGAKEIVVSPHLLFMQMRWKAIRSHLINPDVFTRAMQWHSFGLNKEGANLPLAPIQLVKKTDGRGFVLQTQAGQDGHMWLIWFLYTQLIVRLSDGRKVCPIAEYNLKVGCQKDKGCEKLVGLIGKDGCYWRF